MVYSTRPLTVTAVPAFKDNYLWLIHRGGDAIVVDPGDAAPVERALQQHGLTLRAILLTHHHADHTGGVASLLAARDGAVDVYGPAGEAIAGVDHPLKEGDRIAIEAPRVAFTVLEVPGHTRGHIAYVSIVDPAVEGDEAPLLFCGDTLFAAGCGRLFEGTASQMHASLAKLAALPAATKVYCAHEYTLNNLRFAQVVEPDSEALAQRVADATATRGRGEPTLPSTIALERATNPFLRAAEPAVRAAAERRAAGASASTVATFATLRQWKDDF
jgi:hydroxyacylglutathione hydrolase